MNQSSRFSNLKCMFICIIILLGFTLVKGVIPSGERSALIAFYNATDGDNWGASSWKNPPLDADGFSLAGTEGSWYGVHLDATGDHVARLDYFDDNLNGTLPPEIGDLSELTSLAINRCSQMGGALPANLQNLTKLESLYLEHNGFNGSIPTELGNMGSLKALSLNDNSLSGNIPSQLGNLTGLTTLNLSFNQLIGTIPVELAGLVNLTYMVFEENQLSGAIPSQLGSMAALETLDLSGNQLSGAIPTQLSSLVSLWILDLSENQLTGTIPVVLTNLVGLGHLSINNNQLTDMIPTEIGNMINLESLDLSYNQLTGTIPTVLGNLTKMKRMFLNDNQLTGTIPTQLGNLDAMTRLSLANNDLTGSIPPDLGYTALFYSLDLGGNRLSGPIPLELWDMGHINYLFLNDNQLTGTIPSDIGGCQVMKKLDLGNNLLSGSLPVELGWLTNLSILHLQGNNFVGEIPGNFVDLWVFWENSDELDLGYNGLYTSDADLLYYLNSNDPDWALTQTVAPTGLTSEVLSTTSIRISWTPITYTANGGGYRVYYRTSSGSAWTYAGMTADKTESTYTVNNLSPGVRYYFSVRTRTDAHSANDNVVYSDYSSEVSATTTAIYTLTLQSVPTGGAYITVSPNDINGNGNGTTLFTRSYYGGSAVTITAPAAFNGIDFYRWTIDGAPVYDRSTEVIINGNTTAVAQYQTPASEYTLTVQSSPNMGLAITVSPADTNGDGNGVTNFTRTFNDGTSVDLTAPAMVNGNDFSHWEVNGIESANTTVQVAMTTTTTATAYYTQNAPPSIGLSRTSFNFAAIPGGTQTGAQELYISNTGGGTLDWKVAASETWLTVTPASGSNGSLVSISVDPTGLAPGAYNATLRVTDSNADNSPQSVAVAFTVKETDSEPFGTFETPFDNAAVQGSVPVTGWVLDDVAVENVKIFRTSNTGLVYIGDAVFVEGARPDVEAAFPNHPCNHNAGWGYMMLTNALPNDGNGTFTLQAIVTDSAGHSVNLGSKTITVNNRDAVKPFGTIDLPGQGGTASGNNYTVMGWVMTPQPNNIPTDGSTIYVWVDGVNLGNAVYNLNRPDVAALFPGYANSGGPGGRFMLDTTGYADGLHTIHWIVTDSGGNREGIGSRFFTIRNGSSGNNDSSMSSRGAVRTKTVGIETDTFPVMVKTGYGDDAPSKRHAPGKTGEVWLDIAPLERIEIAIRGLESGYSIVKGEWRPLPVGSTLLKDKGVFTWQPGPGFYGEHRFVFPVRNADGKQVLKKVTVRIAAVR